MQPSIDVLIPVFNAASTVREAVESTQAQSEKNIAIHIVDDGSSDGSASILARLADGDSRIQIHRKENGGIVDALNFGMGFCTAPYIARHDADDLAYPNRLRVQKAYLDANAGCVAVGSAVRHIDGDGATVTEYVPLPAPSRSDPYAYPSREPYIVHPFLMARRDAIIAAGGYRHVCNCEDTDLYWRLQHIGRLHNLGDCLGDYRLHDTSISGGSLKNGRLMAVFSQLAAISEQRRRAGHADIDFTKTLVKSAKAQSSLSELVRHCSNQLGLSGHESRYLALSASGKLLELAGYRPYEIEPEDARFIRNALSKAGAGLAPESRAFIAAQLTGAAADLAMKRHIETALALLSPANYPAFTYKLGLRLAMPQAWRKQLRARMLAFSSVER